MAGDRNPFGRVLIDRRQFPHEVNILPRQDIDDDAGGRIVNPKPVASQYRLRCWVQPLSFDEVMEYARRDIVATHKIVFVDEPIVTVGDRVQFDGHNLVVTGKKNPLQMGFIWEVPTRLVADGPF